jgi:hypothetical protein
LKKTRRGAEIPHGLNSIGSPAYFSKLIAGQTEGWGKVIKFANIKAG